MAKIKAIGRKNLKKLRDFMESNKIDLVIFKSPDVNVRYFSNFVGSCLLAITKNERILFTHPLELERAREQADVEEIINVKDFDWSYGKAIKERVECKKVGIIKSAISLKLFEDLKKMRARFVDVENFIAKLRAIKFREEIKLLKKSASIASSGIKIVEEVLSGACKGKIKEKELAEILGDYLRERAEGLAFEILVASGKRSAFPHPFPYASSSFIKKGLGYVDFGVVYKGYCSDITVPFVVGRMSEREKQMVKTLEKAYELATSSIEIGMKTWKLYEKVEEFLKSEGFELKHGLGHGLGLTVHDYPSISPKPRIKDFEMEFKPGMVFTLEPGIYTKRGGLRLENDFVLTKKGLKKLTHARIIWC